MNRTNAPSVPYAPVADARLVTLVRFESVADERNSHLCNMLLRHLVSLMLPLGSMICLVDILDWEVLCVDVRIKLGMERSPHVPNSVPLNTVEVAMVLDFNSPVCSASMTKTIIGIT